MGSLECRVERKRVARVQELIHEVFVRGAVKLVGPRFHDDIEQAAAGLPKFRGIIAGLDGHFLNRVRTGLAHLDGEVVGRSHVIGGIQPFDAVRRGIGGRAVYDHVEIREITHARQKHHGVIWIADADAPGIGRADAQHG